MICYRKILLISNKDHVTNEEVRAKIKQAIGLQEDLTIETQTAMAWTCLPFIRSGQKLLLCIAVILHPSLLHAHK